jgi:hypothetical protein
MLTITIEGTTEPHIISAGRDRQCPLCGNLFNMGSFHGLFDFDSGKTPEVEELIAANEFGNLVCPACLQAVVVGGANGLRARMLAYAKHLEVVVTLLKSLADGEIDSEFNARDVIFAGAVTGGPLVNYSPPIERSA